MSSERAKILIEALPYIQKFQGETIVIKYGGSIMNNEALRRSFAQDIVLLRFVGINPVIVHGGGKEISKWMERLGKEARFIDGLRYTDPETMEITEMVLSGKMNRELVNIVNLNGGRAVGLSGKDGKLFQAQKIRSKNGDDLGLVGDFASADTAFVRLLTGAGYIPIISSIGTTATGETLNMNADTVASGIAAALKARKLIFMTDVQGVIKEGKLIHSLNLSDAQDLLSHPDIKGGMLPKLQYAIRAIEGGVDEAHIIDGGVENAILLELLTSSGIGTMFTK